MINSREKGKAGEREAAKEIAHCWNTPDLYRTAQVDGKLSADLVCSAIPGLHIEVKRRKRIQALDFLKQAERDANSQAEFTGEPRAVPVVVMREDGDKRWAVMLPLPSSMAFVGKLWRWYTGLGKQL